MAAIGVALLWAVSVCVLLALVYRKALATRWREPVIGAPVLILESDDWGYGSSDQAAGLDRIADLLAAFQDRRGRHPVMTLGVVLAGPDTDRLREDGCRIYHRVTLADPRLTPIRDAMLRGAARGVFALQLHGLEHYWPACLMRAAKTDGQIRAWLTERGFPATEALPSALQSRWIDTSELPSTPLPTSQTMAAATEESEMFAAVFGAQPEVVVPPTFVWTREVESAWARSGIRVVVTPGRRSESRDEGARLIPIDREYYNGAPGPDGMSYVVRDNYFEPSLGHTHQRAIRDLQRNTHLGRPTLIEIHRANFIGDASLAQRAREEVTRLLETACAQFPDIQFMNTAELARSYRERSNLLKTSIGARLHFLLRRMAEISRLRKLAWATGIALPAWLAYLITWPCALRGPRES